MPMAQLAAVKSEDGRARWLDLTLSPRCYMYMHMYMYMDMYMHMYMCIDMYTYI